MTDIDQNISARFEKAHPVSDFMNRMDLGRWNDQVWGGELYNPQRFGSVYHMRDRPEEWRKYRDDPVGYTKKIDEQIARYPEIAVMAAQNIDRARNKDATKDLTKQRLLKKMRDPKQVANRVGIDRPTNVALVREKHKSPDIDGLLEDMVYTRDVTEDPKNTVTMRDYAEYGKEMADEILGERKEDEEQVEGTDAYMDKYIQSLKDKGYPLESP